MLCVPPPRAGAEQPAERTGAAPALSIALEQLPASPSQVQREHGKKLPGDRGLLVRKGISAIEKKNYWQAKKIQGLFYPLRTNDAFTFLIHISRCSNPPAVAVCLCPSHKQQVFVLSPCLAGANLAPTQPVGVDASGVCDPH